MKINDVVFEAAAMIPTPAAQPAPGAAKAAPGAVKPVAKTTPAAPATPAATAPATPAAPADPVAAATQKSLDKLGSRVGAAAGSDINQVTDAYQQSLLDRMGKRFGLPPGSSMEQVQAAQQAHLDKTNPAVAAQYKQNMANIDADKPTTPIKYGPADATTPAPPPSKPAPNAPAPTAPAAPATPAAPTAPAKPSLGTDFDAGLAAQKSGGSPVDIMLAQPTIANNQKLVDAIGSAFGLPPGSSVEQVKAAAAGKGKPAAQPAPVAEDVQRMIELAGLAK